MPKAKKMKEEPVRRKAVTIDTLLPEFNELITRVENEITRIKSTEKATGVKFLRSVIKGIKNLRNRTSRLTRQKRKIRRDNNNSGFQKKVTISKDMAKFAGWDPETKYSRVDVTKMICKYIADNNLQNPEDRRQIRPDTKLRKLLGYDPKKDKEPLTYFRVQSYLSKQNHFPKEE